MKAQPSPDDKLMREIRDLKAQVAAIGQQAFLANAGIKAFLAPNGTNRGIRVFDNAGAERVRLGISEAGNYGLTVNDGTRDRVQVGGITGGAYGAEVRDASGNLIWDTTGLMAVTRSVGTSGALLGGTNAFTTTFTDATGTSGTYTQTRAGLQVLIQSNVCFYVSTGTASFGYVRLVGYASGGGVAWTSPTVGICTNGGGTMNAAPYAVVSGLAADTYTVKIQYRMDAGATSTLTVVGNGDAVGIGSRWDAFQLGN